jgi:hypothetical protein
MRNILTSATLALLVTLGAVSCNNNDQEGTMENAGEKVDKAAHKADNKIEQTVNKTGQAAKRAGHKMGEATERAGQKTQNATH